MEQRSEADTSRRRFSQARRVQAGRSYKMSTFTHTIQRRKRWNNSTDDTFDCKYKFDVNNVDNHRELLHIDYVARNDDENHHLIKDEGIVLVIVVQWDVISSPIEGIIGTKTHLTAHCRTFYLHSTNLNNNHVEVATEGIVSPVIYDLGIRSHHDHRSVTNQLVSAVAQLYNDGRDLSKLIELNVDIAVEIKLPTFQQGLHVTLKDMTRFFMAFGTLARKDNSKNNNDSSTNHTIGEEEELCCCICLNNESFDDCQLVRLARCAHMFHEDCIMEWLMKKSNCPLCRTGVLTFNGDKAKWRACSKVCHLL